VTVGAFDVSKVTAVEVEFGRQLYKAHACIGCHRIENNGWRVGGLRSVSLAQAGCWPNMDWLFCFGQHPQDSVPHSGEVVADITEPQLHAIESCQAVQGVKDFRYDEPWTSQVF
jgi:hypothetical protein